MTKDFDLTLIGARFPQLALGTLMAKRGHRVLIVHQGTENGETPKDSSPTGFTFRKRPSPLFGLDSEGLLRRFLDEIGIGRMLVSKSYPVNPISYQVVLPRHRINVYSDRERLLEEIRREFPDSIQSFHDFYGELDGLAALWYENCVDLPSLERTRQIFSRFSSITRGSREARGMSKLLGHLGGTPHSEAGFVGIQHHFLGSYPLGEGPEPLPLALIHNVARRGTFQEPTGTSSLSDLMKVRFSEFGGEIQGGLRVTAVEGGGRNSLTIIDEKGIRIRTRTLSTTSDIASVVEGLTKQKEDNAHRSSVHPVRFYLGLDDAIVPVGMEDNLFYMREDDGGPLGLKALYIALSPSGSEMAPDGKRSMTVTGLISESRLRNLTDEQISQVQDDIVKTLEPVIPFLEEGLDFTSSDLQGTIGNVLPRALSGGILSWAPALIGKSRVQSSKRGRVAVLSLPPRELGLEGEVLAALAAAGSLRNVLGKGK